MGKLTAVQRQQLFADRKDGMSIKSLVNKYGICRKSVQRWVSEGFKSHPNWEDGARSGRPRSLSSAQRKKARASAQRGHTAPHIAASISQQAQHGVSPATVRRALTGSKCPMYWAPKNRGRVLSEANKAKRLAFCLKSKAAMEAMGMQLLQDFPPQSWDLNIIENCWGVMEQKLAGIAGRSPTTIKGWRARIKRAWASISQSTINRLVASLDQRVADIKVLKGAWLRAKAG